MHLRERNKGKKEQLNATNLKTENLFNRSKCSSILL